MATGRKKKITADNNVCFEDALGKLEIIVSELEDGQLSLEEALVKFEEGIVLSRHCMRRLQEIEAKIDLVLSDEEGLPTLRPAVLGGDKEC